MHNNSPSFNKTNVTISNVTKNSVKTIPQSRHNSNSNSNANASMEITSPIAKDVDDKTNNNAPKPTKKITLNGMILTCCIALHAFYMGYKSSSYFKQKYFSVHNHHDIVEYTTKHHVKNNNDSHLPIPTLHPDKQLPEFKYTYKHYGINEDDIIVRSSHTLLIEDPNNKPTINIQDFDHNEEEIYEPAGQHLLIDIKNVNSNFLDSEQQLSEAIIDIINKSKLTLLSYHCHGLYPNGVSCVGVLLESHISLHTWPDDGVILLDLFTCGGNSLLPLVGPLYDTFGRFFEGCLGEECKPRMVWSHKLRGFRNAGHIYDKDIAKYVLENMLLDYKQEIVSFHSKENIAVNIYDIIDTNYNSIASYELSTNTNQTTYQSTNPQYYKPNRYIFFNGMLYQNSLGYDILHESFIHPGLFASSSKSKVWVVVGGGDGSTIQQVLKHNVDNVFVNEPYFDENDRNVMHEHLPLLNDCSAFTTNSSSSSCYDDTRVEISNQHPLQYCNNETFGVAILDVPLLLLGNDNFANTGRAFYDFVKYVVSKKMNDNGVLIMKLGSTKQKKHKFDGDVQITVNGHYSFKLKEFKSMFEEDSYHSVHFYQESHVKFNVPIVFGIMCKDEACTNNWMKQSRRNIEKHLHELDQNRDNTLFHYFDAIVFDSYRNQKFV